MMLMEMMKPTSNHLVCQHPHSKDNAKKISAAQDYNRSLYKLVGEKALNLAGDSIKTSPARLAQRHITVENTREAARYLRSAADFCLGFIGKSLEFTCEEVKALTEYLGHPVQSADDLFVYFRNKPSAAAKLLKILGVDVPDEAIMAISLEEDLETAEELFPILLKHGADPVKMFNKDMGRLRGKIVLTAIKALLGDRDDALKNLESYAMNLLTNAAGRVVTKSYKEAVNFKGTESAPLAAPASEPEGQNPVRDDEGFVYYDAQEN